MSKTLIESARVKLGFKKFSEPQLAAFEYWTVGIENDLPNPDRLCVYYPTGKGKTEISLVCIFLRELYTEVLVIAPPTTQDRWVADGAKLGLTVIPMSHAKFRDPKTQVSRKIPVIVDEFHLLEGQRGQGWKKLDRLSASLQAPLIICSATPEYNDVERVYCVAHVIDRHNHKGGYEGWIYEHCLTKPSKYSRLPVVLGLRNYDDAEHMLSELPGVVYLPDTAPDILVDVPVHSPLPGEFDEYNLDVSRGRLMASQMEKRHRERYLQIVDTENRGHDLDVTIREDVYNKMLDLVEFDDELVLIYCNHSSIAEVLFDTMRHGGTVGLVTGDTSKKDKSRIIEEFRKGKINTLIGTATLATGTDGIDKVCDTMIILDDTDDASLRRQLVGRILPRGLDTSTEMNKTAYRFVFIS